MSAGLWAVGLGLPALVVAALRGSPAPVLAALPGLYLLGRALAPRVGRGPALTALALLLYGTTAYAGLVVAPQLAVGTGFSLGALVLALALDPGPLHPTRALGLGLAAGLAAAGAPGQGALVLLILAPEPDAAARTATRVAALAAFAAGALLPVVPVGPVPALRAPELGVALFGPAGGLLSRSPVLWGGLAGLLLFPRSRRTWCALAAIGAAVVLVATRFVPDDPLAHGRLAALLPLLGLGLARALRRARDAAAARPLRALVVPAALLVAWNFLFMQLYRGYGIPRDATVSFVDVAEGNARVLWHAAGAPVSWPANWLLALRWNLPASRWDTLAERRAFRDPAATHGVVDVGADEPLEEGLLGEGWSVRRPCETETCRDLLGRARLFVPLDHVSDLDLDIRLRGTGFVRITPGGEQAALVPLPPRLASLGLEVPAGNWQRGLNAVTLELVGESTAQVARLDLRRRRP